MPIDINWIFVVDNFCKFSLNWNFFLGASYMSKKVSLNSNMLDMMKSCGNLYLGILQFAMVKTYL